MAGLTMLLGRGALSRLACELTGVGREDRVVDVGCGPGGAVRQAASRGARVTGVDPAPVMLGLARTLTRRPGVAWLEGTAEALPVPEGAATVLWSIATVHHWSDLDTGLAEAGRALAPGGRLLVAERRTRPGATGLASHGWTDEQAATFADLCLGAGFTDVQTERREAGRHRLWVVQAVKPGP